MTLGSRPLQLLLCTAAAVALSCSPTQAASPPSSGGAAIGAPLQAPAIAPPLAAIHRRGTPAPDQLIASPKRPRELVPAPLFKFAVGWLAR